MIAVSHLPTLRTPERAKCLCDISAILPEDFRTQSGEKLSSPEIGLRLHGDIENPAIVVAGGISAGRIVADAPGETGWWRDVVGDNCAINIDKFCVIGFDFLPNGDETACTISSRDQARALAIALEKVNVSRIRAFVGASYGGMVALAFAEEFPDRIDRLCVISAADRPHPAATALRGVQRRIVEFARRAGAPAEGVSLARQLAMVTYRTPEEFAQRFAHAPGAHAGDPHEVCKYLIARGNDYDMSPARFVTLSDSIDRHAVDTSKITIASLFLAAASDRLVPPADVARAAGKTPNARFVEFPSLYGHDAFLKDAALFGPHIQSFIEEA